MLLSHRGQHQNEQRNLNPKKITQRCQVQIWRFNQIVQKPRWRKQIRKRKAWGTNPKRIIITQRESCVFQKRTWKEHSISEKTREVLWEI